MVKSSSLSVLLAILQNPPWWVLTLKNRIPAAICHHMFKLEISSIYFFCFTVKTRAPVKFITHMESHRIAGDAVRNAEIDSCLSQYPKKKKKKNKEPRPCLRWVLNLVSGICSFFYLSWHVFIVDKFYRYPFTNTPMTLIKAVAQDLGLLRSYKSTKRFISPARFVCWSFRTSELSKRISRTLMDR